MLAQDRAMLLHVDDHDHDLGLLHDFGALERQLIGTAALGLAGAKRRRGGDLWLWRRRLQHSAATAARDTASSAASTTATNTTGRSTSTSTTTRTSSAACVADPTETRRPYPSNGTNLATACSRIRFC